MWLVLSGFAPSSFPVFPPLFGLQYLLFLLLPFGHFGSSVQFAGRNSQKEDKFAITPGRLRRVACPLPPCLKQTNRSCSPPVLQDDLQLQLISVR